MSIIKLDTGFNIELSLPITTFPKRCIAWMLDLLIQLGWMYFIDRLLKGMLGWDWNNHYQWVGVLCFLPVFLYHLFFEAIWNGQSPGKKITRIRVITKEGGQPSLSQYLLRWAFKAIDLPFWILAAIIWGQWPPLLFLFLFSGLACFLLTPASQRIGDLLAGTVVVDLRNKTSWEDTVFMEVEADYEPMFPQVMQLTDNDLNAIKQILTTTSRRENAEYIDRVTIKVKHALKIESDLPGIDFLAQLLKDYNHLSTK